MSSQPSVSFVPARAEHRNIALDQLAAMLRDQCARAVDVYAGAGAIRSVGSRLVLHDTSPHLGPDGVTMTAGTYRINDIAIAQIAEKLSIPLPYLRRLASDHVDLCDANINGWLERTDRRFLVRTLRTPSPTLTGPTSPTGLYGGSGVPALGGSGSGLDGVVRAFLSDRYLRLDNLDVLLAALEGVHSSGANVTIEGCDLSDRRMYVRMYAPGVQALAPTLLANYRSPFDSRPGSQLPVVWGGFVIRNSETGSGAFAIYPRLMVQVCRNGMVLEHASNIRRTHLGAKFTGGDGIITASAQTLDKSLELITSITRDAVRAYLDPDFVQRMVRDLEHTAGTPVTDPDTTIKVVSQKLKFTEAQQNAILAHFIRGGDLSAGGVMHAVTSVAQTLTDPDSAYDMETDAMKALQLAAST